MKSTSLTLPPRPGLFVRSLQALTWTLAQASGPAQRLGTILGGAMRRIFGRRDLEILRRNVHRVWNLPPQNLFARQFARQVIHHQIAAGWEFLVGLFRPEALTIEGLPEFQALMRAVEKASGGRGMVLVTGHVGCWELLGQCCAQVTGRRFWALAKPSGRSYFTAYLAWMRERMGLEVVWTERTSLLRDMKGILTAGEWLAFVMDQNPRARKGVEVSFFGHPTTFGGGAALMAQRHKAPVVAAFCVRTGFRRYKLIGRPLFSGDDTPRLEDATTAMVREIERVIRLYPEQWCWNYKKWRFLDESSPP